MAEKFIHGVTNYEEWRNHEKDNKKYLERMEIIGRLLPKKDHLTFAEEVQLVMCIVVSELTGKLEDFYAVSTSVLMNLICQKRAQNPKSICFWCYAAKQAASRSTLCLALETNYIILNNFLISEEAWSLLAIPTINQHSRIEAHGDVASVISAINYNRIVSSHRYIDFGVFSKNLDIWKRVFDTEGKPENMQFIASSPIVNVVMEIPEDMKKYVNHVFTVYDADYAKEHNIVINCGMWINNEFIHKCKYCMRCYLRGNAEYYISELKK